MKANSPRSTLYRYPSAPPHPQVYRQWYRCYKPSSPLSSCNKSQWDRVFCSTLLAFIAKYAKKTRARFKVWSHFLVLLLSVQFFVHLFIYWVTLY